jgi:hypothetical protein
MKTVADPIGVARSNLAVQASAMPRQRRGRRPRRKAAGDIRVVQSVEHRFWPVNHLPVPIQWPSVNGSPYTARDTRSLARMIGLVPLTTLVQSPQSNGMSEAFVKTFKRDYARVHPTPNAATVLDQPDDWFQHYNRVHPRKALGYRSPREFRDGDQAAPNRSYGRCSASNASQRTVRGRGESSPPATRSAETRSVWLDASPVLDQL